MLELLRAYFRGRPDVDLAFLFGSVARGEATARSDVDVAVRLMPAAPRQGLRDPVLSIGVDLGGRVGRQVDVLDLDRASPPLAYAVAVDGVLLAEAEEGLHVSFRAAAFDRYADTAPLRRLREIYLLEDLRGRV